MWCIVIKDANGEHHREAEEIRPTIETIDYWESHYKTYRIDPKAPYYDNSYSINAVVINVFEVADN